MFKNVVINNFKIVYCVYTIRCNKTNRIYVGMTSNISQRISNHISGYKSGTSKCTSRHVFEKNDYTIDVLMNDLTKEDAIKSEYYFILAFGSMAINQNKPIITNDMKIYYKEYYKNNKEKYNKIKPVVVVDVDGDVVMNTTNNAFELLVE
jgi:predicted GIY-YIG superfamily endonuclease